MCTLSIKATGSDEGNLSAGEPLVPAVVIPFVDHQRALSTRRTSLAEAALTLLSQLSALISAVSLK